MSVFQDVKSFFRTCISGNNSVFFAPSLVIFYKNNLLIDFQRSFNLCCLPQLSHGAINLSTRFFQRWIVSSPAITRTMREPKQGDHQKKYCPLFHLLMCVISKEYNLGRTSSLNYQKTKSQPLAKHRGMLKPLPTLTQVFSSFFAYLFLIHKLKNSEIASALCI